MAALTTKLPRLGALRSVRLRLLVLALIPLIVLMPLLLLLGMGRWTSDYDKVLIANVESDLRIAEQYLAQLMAGTGDDLHGVADSSELARVLDQNPEMTNAYLIDKRQALGLDFLYYLPEDEAQTLAQQWPVIASGLRKDGDTQIDIFGAPSLQALRPHLAKRARIELIPTDAAMPTTRDFEDRGMVVHSAAPVRAEDHIGVLVGGILLNRNLQFIDTINTLVYLNAITGGDRQGTATLFLDDVRVSTNVRLFEDERALGTRVSEAVRTRVLTDGNTWLDRAFVVNDWYISGYLPLTDSFGERVGMLYVGFLEAPFSHAKRAAYLWMMGAFGAVLILSAPLFLWLAKGIFAPLEHMTQTMRRVGAGDLSARHGRAHSGDTGDEIAQVARHLDDLLDQIQDRDQRLRAYAQDLNQRVEERTSELRDANDKLEETYRQLVLSEKLASIGEITAGVAHEINNPVAVIQGNVDVIRDSMGDGIAPIEVEVDLIDQQVARIEAIVGKLLQFARPSDFSDMDERIDLGPVVRDCLILVDHVLAKGHVTITTDLAQPGQVRIATGEIQQVIVNLLINAVQAMQERGEIRITLAAQGNGVALSVMDSGPGIAPERIGAVFDPFFTTKQAQGTGLGLSISQTLIQRAGGQISVDNESPLGGARFTIWLPLESAQ
jgi:two-component system NtrC family sensor kinase